MIYYFNLLLLWLPIVVFAQNDTTKHLSFAGYTEMYYSYDFSEPINHEKPNFIYNHKRHNEVNANLLLVKANYTGSTTRANLGVMAGNYPQYNLSSEPNWAQFVYEANIGVKLMKKNNLWLDVGIMPSHIGFESAISADCWTLTRSILAENSPYYETGAKISYTNAKENLTISGLLLNGWQSIRNTQGLCAGLQINYKPIPQLTLNYSNFLGKMPHDSLQINRLFHNLYLQYEPHKKIGLIAGFDIGNDQYNNTSSATWLSPVIILRYGLSKKINLALRTEYYNDTKQTVVQTNTSNGLQILGISSNLDYTITDNVKCRIEGKAYYAKDAIFHENRSQNYAITTNMTIRF